MHRFDGAEQYFTRAVDFGFSFSVEETFEKWGRDEITADYVRLIRMIRPDVDPRLCGRTAPGGASTIRRRRSSRATPSSSPAIRRSIPSRSRRACVRGSRESSISPAVSAARARRPRRRRLLAINLAVYDPLLGKTYSEIGTEARSMHKCQGMAQLLALPGPSPDSFQLVESTIAGQLDARRAIALRRCRHLDRRSRAVRRRQTAARAGRRTRHDRKRRAERRAAVRHRRRRRSRCSRS